MVRLRMLYMALNLALFVALACAFEKPAYAYVDPGSSMLLLQGFGAFVTGVLFYCRQRILRVLKWSDKKLDGPNSVL